MVRRHFLISVCRLKEEAVRQALTEQHKILREKSSIECERRIKDAVKRNKAESEKILAQHITATQTKSKKIYDKKLVAQEQLHVQQIKSMHDRYVSHIFFINL